MIEIEEKIKRPAMSFYKKANLFYVYRHYFYNENGREITFYVGKGQGMRALSENGRSELWQERVRKLERNYFIDIVEFFETEEKALEFEKELISYYSINEFGCECNIISKSDKIDIFLDDINIKTLECLMDSNLPLIDILKTFVSTQESLKGKRLIDIIIPFMKLLRNSNSKYEILFKKGASLNDIDSYSYSLINC